MEMDNQVTHMWQKCFDSVLKSIDMEPVEMGTLRMDRQEFSHIDSVIQCLSHLPFIMMVYLKGSYRSSENVTQVNKGSKLAVFGNVVKQLWTNEEKSAIDPGKLYG